MMEELCYSALTLRQLSAAWGWADGPRLTSWSGFGKENGHFFKNVSGEQAAVDFGRELLADLSE